jgi:hypothetical protein
MVKKVFSVTISDEVLSKWKNYTDEGCVNSSKLIEKLMKSHLIKRGIKENAK